MRGIVIGMLIVFSLLISGCQVTSRSTPDSYAGGSTGGGSGAEDERYRYRDVDCVLFIDKWVSGYLKEYA
ncbi:hypothetical protein [Entomospira culicis]|uniref:hypothetical protein n=1 Tax=Entomospira culicis TaxID=2719989 RepID=UPI002368C525|nr:hypothetical protein [Entomospira culicis]WDI38026.1 hypothetical protein PVA46_07760 [Entomospira culicis]WDI39649.1 hypothetical protein PVA47_07760 [Entomospira culicis]